MREMKLYNPLFESLMDSAHRYQNGPDFMIKEEDEGKKMKKEDVIKYLEQIFNMFTSNVTAGIISYPFGDIKGELLKNALETYESLKENQNMKSLIEGLKKVFNEASTKVSGSKYSDKVKYIWTALKEGVELLIKAYEALAKRAGSLIEEKEILSTFNTKMTTYVDEFKKAIEDSKKISSSAKK